MNNLPAGGPVTAPPSDPPGPRPRRPHLHYLDNLRVAMILMVVVHHAAQPYGPADWWYFRGDRQHEDLATLSAVGGAFRMSLLFFVAAYLVPRSVDGKGGWAFARGRLARLGVPFLVGSATIIPALMYTYYVQYRGYPPISYGRYYLDVFLGFGPEPAGWTGPIWPDLQFGHLWFIQNLLVFSLLYLACRAFARLAGRWWKRPAPAWLTRAPGHRSLLGLTFGLAVIAFLVRVDYPLDEWVPLFEFVQAEPARLAQYTAFFAAGVLAYRYDWLGRLSRRVGYTWLAVGSLLTAGLFVTGTDTPYFATGGASAASACWTLVETALCVGLSVGLLTLFRDVFTGHHRLSRAMADGSYTIYLIHLPIVVALQFAFAGVDLPVPVLFAAVATLAMVASVAIAVPLRRLPGLRAVL
ncbi:acyltransferase family protein [Micromonospora radicis]|uniref:Acyltransferase n=1 Tax=Micromonospora radicis TaxID=1894971 RepID=A0A418MTJ7_9ACTN|nr:acyltransferase family protein [Micromonospora radicis]RIV37431.1 acyltransferase [Micromonospora radicis]